ncbi:Retrovirus-related Pol polyprotein from transposon TNT 1-94 [Araneus ventricosus]|uniref:Retrovirus-related Pol polyprotein from transposon TNT 1-94 n=1 Tax=Araneus ventricosus TaxID=182803 RepID=A0A4Y2JC01_ARAVE|nr:Retrovirus-related Pol polyprotein from transposon TNT 1-94 [Araneus ventricosus]
MRRNLIAGANLDIAGFKVIWKNNELVIYDEFNDYLCTVNGKGKLDILYGRKGKLDILYGVPEKCISNEYNNTSTRKSIDIETVHRRFGHINVNVLNFMSNHNIVKDIESIQGKLSNCDVCKTSTLTRISMKTNYAITTKALLARVYMDIWGPAPTKSLGGNLYFISIIDDFSRKMYVYIIKSNSEVLECFKKYLYRSERELNVELKCVRTDNGLEFFRNAFEQLLSGLGIKMERTYVCTPEQNGVAERFNRTAVEGIRSMLQDSGLKPQFWAEALFAFVHVKNRCVHKLTGNKTPIEIWTGYRPSVRHFRIF